MSEKARYTIRRLDILSKQNASNNPTIKNYTNWLCNNSVGYDNIDVGNVQVITNQYNISVQQQKKLLKAEAETAAML